MSIHGGELQSARILVVDDDADNLAVLQRALGKHGCTAVHCVQDPFRAAAEYAEFEPDLVLLDLRLPPVDGFFVLNELRNLGDPDELAPVILFTGDASEQTKQRALDAGVADFVRKDFDHTELLLRARNALRAHRMFLLLQRHKAHLEETVALRTHELRMAQRETLERLALAAEYRDDQTGEHARRVGDLSAKLAQRMGLEPDFVAAICDAALLHDLGKIGVADAVLRKPGPLDAEQRAAMQEHAMIGAKILDGCTERVLRMAREIALSHHERYDGTGYPAGLKGEEIPLVGRIVAVADAFDAITSPRPYRAARSEQEAMQAILDGCGTHFDPRVTDNLAAVLSPVTLR